MSDDTPPPVIHQLPALTPREAWIRHLVAEAPPLTAEQRDRIRRIVQPIVDRIEAAEKKSA